MIEHIYLQRVISSVFTVIYMYLMLDNGISPNDLHMLFTVSESRFMLVTFWWDEKLSQLLCYKRGYVSLLKLQGQNASTGFVRFWSHFIHILKEALRYLNPSILSTWKEKSLLSRTELSYRIKSILKTLSHFEPGNNIRKQKIPRIFTRKLTFQRSFSMSTNIVFTIRS